MKRNIALIGNQNSGKTLLFNTLTGSNQKVGNWAGVTVEKKEGIFSSNNQEFRITDLPGVYDINHNASLDEQITTQFIENHPGHLYFNVVDSTNLHRALYLTLALRERGIDMVVLLNKTDLAQKLGISIDIDKLEHYLGVKVVPLSLKNKIDTSLFYQVISEFTPAERSLPPLSSEDRVQKAHEISQIVGVVHRAHRISTFIDKYATARVMGIVIFLMAIYLLFFFSISVGGAFIDFFDILSGALFVEGMRAVLEGISTPEIIILILADGIGGGMQVLATFIPIIFSLYLFLSILEQSGYMARAAFVMDKFMRRLGLSGKALVPLIVGFGCNVPGIMATRTLHNPRERLTTVLMSPFMSCGARLAVYALFAAAFFTTGGHSVVFLLYVVGIVFAIVTALILKKGLRNNSQSDFIIELPMYALPSARAIFKNTWFKLKGFITGAGKVIIIVVMIINIISAIKINEEDTILSATAKTITPLFAPLGISEDNWGATVGVITGILAKEVVVGTLDAVYSQNEEETEFVFTHEVKNAFISVKDNILALGENIWDPLGLGVIGDASDSELFARENEVKTTTLSAMQQYFDGTVGAFAYLLFILLYFPCVAAFGAMKKEIGLKWAITGALWATTLAYSSSTIFYQFSTFSLHPLYSSIAISGVLLAMIGFMALLLRNARNYKEQSIAIETLNTTVCTKCE